MSMCQMCSPKHRLAISFCLWMQKGENHACIYLPLTDWSFAQKFILVYLLVALKQWH